MKSWVGESIFGIHVVIYSNRIKLRELFELASRAKRNILTLVCQSFYTRERRNFFVTYSCLSSEEYEYGIRR